MENTNFKNTIIIFTIIVFNLGCKSKNCIITEKVVSGTRIVIRKVDKCNKGLMLFEQEYAKTSTDSLVANGYYRTYFNTGRLASFAFFKNGIQDSTAVKYYENGNKEMEFYWVDGKMRGLQSWYSEDGKKKRDRYFIENSIVLLEASYNLQSGKDSIVGGILNLILTKDINNIRSGEKVIIGNEVVRLKGMNSILSIRIIRPDKSIAIDTMINSYSNFKNINWFPLPAIFRKQGEYLYYAKATLMKDENCMMRDSVELRIVVR